MTLTRTVTARDCSQAAADTLPDYLAADLRLLSVGINPSLRAVREGFYFPNPQNRFWPALNASGLLAAPVTPGPAAMALILARDRIGFTDLCKTPSSMAHHLRAGDYRAGAARLAQVVSDYRPLVLWFHGATAFRAFSRHVLGAAAGAVAPGLQVPTFAGARIFVTPNPSPANARYSLAMLTDCYRALCACLAGEAGGDPTTLCG
ncbi:MAG: G/U mismatch-specific DNA glycosylase [Immundisolibacter sp.]